MGNAWLVATKLRGAANLAVHTEGWHSTFCEWTITILVAGQDVLCHIVH